MPDIPSLTTSSSRPSPSAPGQAQAPAARRRAWRRNVALIGVLLLVWLVAAFVPGFFARELHGDVFGWPFSFWMAAFGGPLAFLSIIGLYAWLMNRGVEAVRQAGGR